MDQDKSLASLQRKLLIFLCIICAQAKADEDQTAMLCISDCASCPVICAPPPPPSKSKPPPSPPPLHHSPPQSYYFHPPPPPAPAQALLSPPHSPKSNPPPPPSYISWGSGGSPPSPPPPPPPTPPKSMTIPANQVPPGSVTGERPYYYFYAADASSLSFNVFPFLVLVFAFHVFLLLG